jgi:hypothetical protein
VSAALELLDGFLDAAVLAPVHVDVARDLPGEREVVVPLHEHGHLHAGLENGIGLDRAGPCGHPLGGVAGAIIGNHQQVIDARLVHRVRQQLVAARVFRVGKARVFLLEYRFEPRLEI